MKGKNTEEFWKVLKEIVPVKARLFDKKDNTIYISRHYVEEVRFLVERTRVYVNVKERGLEE